jgi:hypothetical protein
MSKPSKDAREQFFAAIKSQEVKEAAQSILDSGKTSSLTQMLELSRAIADACGAKEAASILRAELIGYSEAEVEIPAERKALGFASPFPVRALDLGLLDPEEIFLANREKFSQVTLTIGQPIEELQSALAQIRQGGVLALRVPASEVTGESASTDDDTEVFIYILPREIQRIVDAARARALETIVAHIAAASVGDKS